MDYQQIVVYTVIAIPANSKSDEEKCKKRRFCVKGGYDSEEDDVEESDIVLNIRDRHSISDPGSESPAGLGGIHKILWLYLFKMGLTRALVCFWKRFDLSFIQLFRQNH